MYKYILLIGEMIQIKIVHKLVVNNLMKFKALKILITAWSLNRFSFRSIFAYFNFLFLFLFIFPMVLYTISNYKLNWIRYCFGAHCSCIYSFSGPSLISPRPFPPFASCIPSSPIFVLLKIQFIYENVYV